MTHAKAHSKIEEETPESIKKWKKMHRHADRLIQTTEHRHRKAYNAAVEKHLMEGGIVVLDKLDEDEVQREFVKTMSEHYITEAKNYLGIHKDLSDDDKLLLMLAYSGTTEEGLRQMVGEHGKDFTYKTFSKEKDKWIEKLAKELYSSATSHFKDEDVEDIIRYTGLGDYVDAEQVNREQALGLLMQHKASGDKLSPKEVAKDLKKQGLVGLLTEGAKEFLEEGKKKKKEELEEELKEYSKREYHSESHDH